MTNITADFEENQVFTYNFKHKNQNLSQNAKYLEYHSVN